MIVCCLYLKLISPDYLSFSGRWFSNSTGRLGAQVNSFPVLIITLPFTFHTILAGILLLVDLRNQSLLQELRRSSADSRRCRARYSSL